MRPRWCVRCRDYISAWLVVTVGGRKTRRCGHCGWVTRARKPRAPKHQAADRRWSKAVRQRDGFKCRRCGAIGGDGAHIKAKGPNPKVRHNTANGLDLCRRCHTWAGEHTEAFHAWLAVECPGLLEELTEAAR